MSQRKHGPLAIRLVGFYENPLAPLQINVVCTHCLGMMCFNHPQDLFNFLIQDCPKTVIPISTVETTGEFDYVRLCDELEKRKQI